MGTSAVEEFQAQRGRLFGLAYRLLGSAQEAEDVVQDAYLRWQAADRGAIVAPPAWLAKVVTNLCVNRLTSARVRREQYIGPWLPEPVPSSALGPLDTAEQRDSVSLALLVLMERLTPVERAVFVLREAFGYGHREIAATLDVSETNSRQLYRRAAERLRRPRRHGPLDRAHWRELVERFLAAARDGDLPRLEEMLAADVVSWADGGGKVVAARRPVVGRSHVARYMSALSRRFVAGLEISVADVNGEPAALFRLEGSLAAVFAVEIADGKIAALRIIANPDKLDFIGRQAGLSHSGGVAGSF